MASTTSDLERQDAVCKFWYGKALEEGFTEANTKAAISTWYGVDLTVVPPAPYPKEKKDALDREISERFGADVDKLAAGEYDHWAATAGGVTAICVLGDQFTRNMYRGQAKAFSLDSKVLEIVLGALDRGIDKDLHYVQRSNWYLPLMHSEDLELHKRVLAFHESMRETLEEDWLKAQADNSLRFERSHMAMIERFGRYPYRNKVLGRASTPEEEEFLNSGVDTFGQ